MGVRIHFISGLPRSGSTLLAAILKQNPRFVAGIQSPLSDLMTAALRAMSGSESALFISDEQRHRVLRGIFDSFYCHHSADTVVFDSNRSWCALLPTVAALMPESRVICCVRSPAWIVDSVERQVQSNPLTVSRMFGHEVGNVYARAETLATKQLLAPALNALRTAWFGEHANRLLVVRYDSLVGDPLRALAAIYQSLDQPLFEHDFANVNHSEPEFDSRLGFPGLHTVEGGVAPRPRKTVLPTDLFKMYDQEFWNAPDENPRGVAIL